MPVTVKYVGDVEVYIANARRELDETEITEETPVGYGRVVAPGEDVEFDEMPVGPLFELAGKPCIPEEDSPDDDAPPKPARKRAAKKES